MTIEQALAELDNCGNLGPAVRVVCAEVRRLRAAVEAVEALPSYEHMDTYMAMRRVLAALEATDAD